MTNINTYKSQDRRSGVTSGFNTDLLADISGTLNCLLGGSNVFWDSVCGVEVLNAWPRVFTEITDDKESLSVCGTETFCDLTDGTEALRVLFEGTTILPDTDFSTLFAAGRGFSISSCTAPGDFNASLGRMSDFGTSLCGTEDSGDSLRCTSWVKESGVLCL